MILNQVSERQKTLPTVDDVQILLFCRLVVGVYRKLDLLKGLHCEALNKIWNLQKEMVRVKFCQKSASRRCR